MGRGIEGDVVKVWWAALALWVACASYAQAECEDSRVDLRGDWGTVRFTVELAETPEERSQGLMHRRSLSSSAGMLFVFDSPQNVVFWMENTLIPLDILFLSAEGVILRIHENAMPLDRTPIYGGDDVKYVLEINGGLARRIGISAGTELRHPRIKQSIAAWPCGIAAIPARKFYC